MSSTDEAIAGAASAMGATTVAMALLLPWLQQRVLDLPNNRSSHNVPTPRGAGTAVVLGVVTGSSVAASWSNGRVASVIVASTILAVVGLVDDMRGLGVNVRFLCQIVVAAGLSISVIGTVDAVQLVLAASVTFIIVGFTNAFNFMDGINGISALNAGVAASWFAWLAWRMHQQEVMCASMALAAALVAFLPWNYPAAKVFLGDVGSYAIGATIAGFALVLWRAGAPLLACVAPLMIYVADTGVAFARRLAGRRPWHEAHREHVYQRLVDYGLPHAVVAPGVAGISLAMCGVWYFVQTRTEIGALAAMIAICSIYLITPALAASTRRSMP